MTFIEQLNSLDRDRNSKNLLKRIKLLWTLYSIQLENNTTTFLFLQRDVPVKCMKEKYSFEYLISEIKSSIFAVLIF